MFQKSAFLININNSVQINSSYFDKKCKIYPL